jgi:hypothetical protein
MEHVQLTQMQDERMFAWQQLKGVPRSCECCGDLWNDAKHSREARGKTRCSSTDTSVSPSQQLRLKRTPQRLLPLFLPDQLPLLLMSLLNFRFCSAPIAHVKLYSSASDRNPRLYAMRPAVAFPWLAKKARLPLTPTYHGLGTGAPGGVTMKSSRLKRA